MNLPFLSIVLPVRNEERHIAEVLNQLIEQDYPRDRLEILVVDGASTDRTREIVAEYSKNYSFIRLLANPKFLSSTARNLGAKKAKGEIIIYIDGHCQIPDKNLLKSIVSFFEKSGADCLGRAQPLVLGDKKITQAIALARTSALGHNPDSFIYSNYEGFVDPTSCGAVYKKSAFEKAGFFDENFDACEDVEFNFRVQKAGLKCYLAPSLAIKYFPRETLPALFKQMFRYGWGRFKLFRKHPQTFSFLNLAPGLYLLLLLVLFVLSLIKPSSAPLFLGLILIYLIPVSVYSFWLSFKHRITLFFYFMLIFPLIHFGISLGFWSALFFSPKRQ